MTPPPVDPGAAADRLRRIVAHIANVPPDSFGPDDDLRVTLGLDSLSALRVAAAVEREFDVTIPDAELHRLTTLSAALKYVEAGSAPPPGGP